MDTGYLSTDRKQCRPDHSAVELILTRVGGNVLHGNFLHDPGRMSVLEAALSYHTAVTSPIIYGDTELKYCFACKGSELMLDTDLNETWVPLSQLT